MTITTAKIGDLTPDENNANKGTERGRYALEKSLTDYGFGRSILIDRNGRIIAGNKTHEVAGAIGLEDVIVVQSDGQQVIAVQRTDLDIDDLAARELAIADNRVGQLDLEWDADVLKELEEEGADLRAFWTDAELDAIYAQLTDGPAQEEKDEIEESEVPDVERVSVRAGVELGSIWQLGRHRVMCGDSTVEANVRALLGDKLAVLVHADPPYGMGKEKDGVLNDNLYRDKLDDFQMKWWKACRGNVADNGSAYIWGNVEDLWRLWYTGGLKDSERLTFRNQIVWYKDPSGLGDGQNNSIMRSYGIRTEYCLFFMVGEQGFNNNADNYWEGFEPIRIYLQSEREKAGWNNKIVADFFGFHPRMADHWFSKSQWSFPQEDQYNRLQIEANGRAFKREYEDLKRGYDDLKREWYSTRAYFDNTHENMTDVWEYPRVQGEERWGHATPKPVDMIARIYKSSSPDDGIIYSPFLGSGTDIIAAQRMEGKRTAYGMELSPEYIEVILQRWENFTGEVAKRVDAA